MTREKEIAEGISWRLVGDAVLEETWREHLPAPVNIGWRLTRDLNG